MVSVFLLLYAKIQLLNFDCKAKLQVAFRIIVQVTGTIWDFYTCFASSINNYVTILTTTPSDFRKASIYYLIFKRN